MERKRPLGGSSGADSLPPPRKVAKVASLPGPAAREPPPNAAVKAEDSADEGTGHLQTFQRAQLAAKVREQAQELEKARAKIEEMQVVVAALDAAPQQAAYFMAACIEDIKLQLEHAGVEVGASGNDEGLDVSEVPLAAYLFESDIRADTLSDQPQLLRRLTAQFVGAFKKANSSGKREVTGVKEEDGTALELTRRSVDDLHARLRAVSDQVERYAGNEKEQALASGTLKDELDDMRLLLERRRRRIVSLEMTLRELRNETPESAIAGAVSSALDRDDTLQENGLDSSADAGGDTAVGMGADPLQSKQERREGTGKGGGDAAGATRGDGEAGLAATRKLASERLEELQTMLEEKKSLAAEVHRLSLDLAQREKGIIPPKDVLASVIYQTMEANLQQLAVSVASLEAERDAAVEERLQERKDAEDRLASVKGEADKDSADLRKLVEDLRRVAESAKAEKDKWVMTYEARKMEANAAAALVAASDRRAAASDAMRDKLKAANASLQEELEDARNRIVESELRAVAEAPEGQLPGAADLAARLEADLRAERQKCSAFIGEVESLSVMFGDLESENARLVKLLAEKESVLSKVMSDKLRGRQQLATVKEEARSLAQGREYDQEKIKNLAMQVSASKRAVTDYSLAATKATEEVRVLAAQLSLQRKVADECTARERVAQVQKAAMEQERDGARAAAENELVSGQTNAFVVRRLSEDNEKLKQQLEETEASLRNAEQATADSQKGSPKDALRDEIIQELMKKLHCSVCPNQPKEVALVRCGHMLSRKCVDQLVAQRSRKCPLCGTSFAQQDVLNVFLD